MSAIIPPKPRRPSTIPLKLQVNSTSSSSSSSSSIPSISTTTPSLSSASSSSSSNRPSLKLTSINKGLSSLSLTIPKDKDPSHYSTSLNSPPLSSSSSSSTESNEGDESNHKWGKGDQARMAGEIKEIIQRPVGLEEDLGGKEKGLRVEKRRVRSGSRVGIRPNFNETDSSSSLQESKQDSIGPSGLNKEVVIVDKNDSENEVLLQDELDVRPGTLLDLGRLGEGCSGEVRKVKHLPTGIIMAKKTISTSPNPKIHKQHLRELLFMRECYNPHIVQYYGAFLEDNDSQIGICMEYCEGGSLEVLYKKVKLNGWRTGEKVLGKIAESVLNGLVYLHNLKIIHRDIKPSNVLVTINGEVKLCDFGVSGELINSLAGTFLGTIFYLSPERIKGGKYSINADVWSMTLTVLEVALNRYPFPAENEAPLTGPFELLTYLINMDSTPRLQDEVDKGIKYTNAFRDFIKQGLDKDSLTRPTPSKLLSHPWIRRSIERSPPADLGGWVRDLN